MRKISEIILHCSATRAGQNFKMADIDRWHKAKGWDGCGYHFVIDLDGTIELGRSITKVGAHCSNRNTTSIGVCYVGGLDPDTGKPADTRTAEQCESLSILLSVLHRMFPAAMLHGHKEYARKACPCFDVSEYLSQVNDNHK